MASDLLRSGTTPVPGRIGFPGTVHRMCTVLGTSESGGGLRGSAPVREQFSDGLRRERHSPQPGVRLGPWSDLPAGVRPAAHLAGTLTGHA